MTIDLPAVPASLRARLETGGAVAWHEEVDILTYRPAEPCRYPMFLDRRVYQGSSGKVYPIPFIDRIETDGTVRPWTAIHLENRWVRLMVLPDLGGRIHVGYDKTTGYDFFYRNNVIKPALVGLAGPWISGGVEFNWPQHHRPATHLPVEWEIEEGDDGSVTVWCSDHDPFARMKGMHGVRLHPDRAVVELVVRLRNRSTERQTFLWWANVAARVHDDYQSFFPSDVRYVADHARRALTAYPAADRPYYGYDYPAAARREPGADRIDWYRNIPVPTSYMIVDTEESFFGGYDHAADAGFVHWADRRISPGKKQWTWGDAPFGHAWDAHLTDADGPYVELMAGVYTDNQPDFSWLMPGETKTFSQYWYPIAGIGVPVQASLDAALSQRRDSEGLHIGVAVTRPVPGARIDVFDGGMQVWESRADLDPAAPFAATLDAPSSARVVVRDAAGHTLVETPQPAGDRSEPWTATEPPRPADVASVDELHIIGTHLVQYRHPTRSAVDYFDEALRRDPGHVGTRIALAESAYRRGEYDDAAEHLDIAIRRLTSRNGNPADSEALYLRGLVELRRGDAAAAQVALAKAMWDHKWQQPALLLLARIAACEGRDPDALADLERAQRLDADDLAVVAARVVVLRRLGRESEARRVLDDGLRLDALDVTLRALRGDALDSTEPRALIDAALELRAAGDLASALDLLERAAARPATTAGNVQPFAHYLRARLLDEAGRDAEAAAARSAARAADRRLAFPAGLDAHDALVAAVAADASDAVASALLGTLLYDAGRRTQAAELWRRALDLGDDDPVTARNLGIAAYNDLHDDGLAWEAYQRARDLDPRDGRLLYEVDQLAKRLGHAPAERLERLEANITVVAERDDLTIEYATLLVGHGRARDALALMEARHLQPWEGGEGLALCAWDAAREALGLPLVEPPASLGEARPVNPPPAAKREDGTTDFFATSLPDLLLFARHTS